MAGLLVKSFLINLRNEKETINNLCIGSFNNVRTSIADWQRSPAPDIDKEFIPLLPGLQPGIPAMDNSCWMGAAANQLAGAGYYFRRIAMHEMGHTLGFGHNTVLDSVMGGGSVSELGLGEGDIEGALAIYGPVPEPTTLCLLGLGGLLLLTSQKKRHCFQSNDGTPSIFKSSLIITAQSQ